MLNNILLSGGPKNVKGLYFDGVNDLLSIINNSSYEIGINTTFEFLVKVKQFYSLPFLGLAVGIFGNAFVTDGYHIWLRPTDIMFYRGDFYTFFPYNFLTGTIYKVKIIFDATTERLYINGVLVFTKSRVFGYSQSTRNFVMGSDIYLGYSYPINIYDFKIFNNTNLVFNMPFESLYKTGANVFTPELVSGNDGQLIGYPTGAKGIVDRFGNDIQLVP